jgi:hypothetical protein
MQFHSFTTSVVPNILTDVPDKQKSLPLSVSHPELAKEAYEWDPSLYTAGSGESKKWKCSKGHIFEAKIQKRTLRGNNCQVCSNRKLITGINDLATTHPELATEAFGWDPTLIVAGSSKKKVWKCRFGHTWEAVVVSRKNGTGCPTCSNRKVVENFNDLQTINPELAKEAWGWDPKTITSGTHKKLEWKCSRGHIWTANVSSRLRGNGCPFCSGKLVLIGFNDLATTHPEVSERAFGWNPQELSFGSSKKCGWMCNLGHVYESTVAHQANGQGCPICVGKIVLPGFNDIATTHPGIARDAHGWDPSQFSAGSHKKLWWKCKLGHIWKTNPHSRSNMNSECPTCAKSGFDPNIPGYLYFLLHPDWQMFQIGITNYPDNRLKQHRRLGWELLELRGPMDGHLTQQWETAILRMLKAKGTDLSNSQIAGKFDGYSEAWSKSTFEVNSIKKLMQLTEEFEESKDSARAKSLES